MTVGPIDAEYPTSKASSDCSSRFGFPVMLIGSGYGNGTDPGGRPIAAASARMSIGSAALPSGALREYLEGNTLDDQSRHGTWRGRAHLGIHAVSEADDALVLNDRRLIRSGHAIVDARKRLDYQAATPDVAVAAGVAVARG